MFQLSPTPQVLHWLAKGRLADRWARAIRLWVLLDRLYGDSHWATQLPQPFRYADVRDRLFSSTHGRSETDSAPALSAACMPSCICQQSLHIILSRAPLPDSSLTAWQQQCTDLTDLSFTQVQSLLEQFPFATVHRSIRDDLNYLATTGWLISEGQGRFRPVKSQQWPRLVQPSSLSPNSLSVAQTWEVISALEPIAFVKPNLEVTIQTLWEQLVTPSNQTRQFSLTEPEKRLFIHLDYILSETMQEHVDTLQEQIEQLWQDGGGVVQFRYSRKIGKAKTITAYPVCLHYSRRAKYLSAVGQDPEGVFGWHNYRLDRIESPKLKTLPWSAAQIPQALKDMHIAKCLPTSVVVEDALKEAWGFNFYLPHKLLIMRFPAQFAQRYVYQTDRHNSFQPVTYRQLTTVIEREIIEPEEKEKVLHILSQRNPKDAYYRAWIRLGDINIVMRLRDWRPNGEVIAPLVLRQKMYQEAQMEISHYQS